MDQEMKIKCEHNNNAEDSHPSQLWYKSPHKLIKDSYGYGRNPAFWFTLNLPYNYLWEIHRFQEATNQFIETDMEYEHLLKQPHTQKSCKQRCEWVVNNADIVSTLHAIRVELNVRYVMSQIVPPQDMEPFLYWLRFEWGSNGNPHVHGKCYVAGNPNFDCVVQDEEVKQSLLQEGHPDASDLRTAHEAEAEVASFFNEFVSEMHPANDSAGRPLYNYVTEMFESVDYAKPHCKNLKEILDEAFTQEEPDFTKLKQFLLALIENGQRHKGHMDKPPNTNIHPCARIDKKTGEIYCRYLYPRKIYDPDEDHPGQILDDPHRPDLKNLFLKRNDEFINNFESHLLLANIGNIDWRPLINLWSVLDYLTKYAAKAGKGTKKLGKVFESVLQSINEWEKEDGLTDFWRRAVIKFYNRILGDRDYTLFETIHFGLRLPGVLSSYGDVSNVSVSNWSVIKSQQHLKYSSPSDRATYLNKIDLFNLRGSLNKPNHIQENDLCDISFYAFWRMYDVNNKTISRRRSEKFVALTGNGLPTHAKIDNENHTDYCKRTLYAYMPCKGLQGTAYIDEVVHRFWNNDWAAAFREFVMDPQNKWCPNWIRRNYETQNKIDPFTYKSTLKEVLAKSRKRKSTA